MTFFDDFKLSLIFRRSENPSDGRKMKTSGKIIAVINTNYINLLYKKLYRLIYIYIYIGRISLYP